MVVRAAHEIAILDIDVGIKEKNGYIALKYQNLLATVTYFFQQDQPPICTMKEIQD